MARSSSVESRSANIRDALYERSRRYEGEVLLAPTAADLAKALGRTIGYIYRDGDYQKTLERISGLKVIHNGLVLAGDIDRSVTALPSFETADFNNMSPREIVGLMGRLTTQLALTLSREQ